MKIKKEIITKLHHIEFSFQSHDVVFRDTKPIRLSSGRAVDLGVIGGDMIE